MRPGIGNLMRKARPSMPVLLFFALVALVFALDTATKAWASAALADGRSVVVVENFFALTLAHNEGGAFGMFRTLGAPWRHLVLFALPVAAMGAFTGYFFFYERDHALTGAAFGLIVGGALGNVIDRARHGHVVDFLDAHWFYKAHWPTFNVADSAVTVGAGLLILEYLRESREGRAEAAASAGNSASENPP